MANIPLKIERKYRLTLSTLLKLGYVKWNKFIEETPKGLKYYESIKNN